jgi:hypothetical protein
MGTMPTREKESTMSLDKLQKAGGFKSKNRTYINKLQKNDATLEVVEAKLFPSTNPNKLGNETFVASFKVIDDRMGDMDVDANGCVNITADLDDGSAPFREKKFEETAELVAVIAGVPVNDIFANPVSLRDLLADSTAYAGKRIVVGSKSPKDGFYNLSWSTEESYIAKMQKLAASQQRQPVNSTEVAAPKAAKRPGKGGGRAAEADAL